ncbi:MAG TPA: hypothetical protein VGL40_13395 [Bacillota bacterium]
MANILNPANLTGAIVTLAVLTFLIKDNPVFDLFQHIFVGLYFAYSVGLTYHSYIKPTIADDILKKGFYSYIIPIILGLMVYFMFIPSLSWIARYPMSFWVGYGVGLTLGFQPAALFPQITSTFIKFWGLKTIGRDINAILLFVCVVTALAYFFFTVRKERTAVGYTAELGRWVIMIALGAAFGNTVLYRVTLFVGRMQFLMGDWLHILK